MSRDFLLYYTTKIIFCQNKQRAGDVFLSFFLRYSKKGIARRRVYTLFLRNLFFYSLYYRVENLSHIGRKFVPYWRKFVRSTDFTGEKMSDIRQKNVLRDLQKEKG